MFADTGARSARFEESCRRLRVGGLAVVLAAALCAAGLAGASAASAATVVKHSAKSGELQDGRLTLHGVSKRVAYSIDGGRSGKISVRRLHRRFFLPGLAATGRLHVAGQRGGRDPRFKLTKPRYNAARHTVSYRAKSLGKRPSPSGATHAAGIPALRNFGAAKLSIVPHPRLASGDNGGNDCQITITHSLGGGWSATWDQQDSNLWSTDNWNPAPPTSPIYQDTTVTWESDGGLARGCHNHVVWNVQPPTNCPPCGGPGTFTFDITWNWGQNGPTYSCTPGGDPYFYCVDNTNAGTIMFDLRTSRS
jgi:hypothetical protein